MKTHGKSRAKKDKYADVRSNCTRSRFRTQVASEMRKLVRTGEFDEYIFPCVNMNTYNWWDCQRMKPKVF